ncbi:hypothetical protein POM88_036046 [Heracleum sosnowskyi]|uniref:Transposase-associated domain-containing protein n=1 Tax=Heracleum sosnowskyi TaxID=360622 RepID=A0AAD8HML4_9APIA|nr:hypothetical protein POM88_036046 [Heracleum sosnowskyi]
MAEDRSWMYNRIEKGLVRSEFRDGVLRFVDFALHQPGCTDGAKIKCPCILPKCRNKRYLEVDEVMIHLCRKGFIPHYEVWSSHGERFVHKDTHVGESSNRVDYRGDYIQMVMDAAGPEMFDVEMDEEPNPDAKKFYELLDAASKPLYPGSEKHTQLSFISRILNVKCESKMSNSAFSDVLQLIKEVIPEPNPGVPGNYYQAKKEETDAFTLPKSRKQSWFDNHRKFLPPNHPFRRNRNDFRKNVTVLQRSAPVHRSGEQIKIVLDHLGLKKVTELGHVETNKRVCDNCGWKRRSIFWDLPYWSSLLIRHNLDFMHIEKNCFEQIFNTVCHIKDKTKDTISSREELNDICRRPTLMKDNTTGQYPKASYVLDPQSRRKMFDWLEGLRFPDGWMYPFERYLRNLKSNVKNKNKVEGSIANAFLMEELCYFTTFYFEDQVQTKLRIVARNADEFVSDDDDKDAISLFRQSGRPLGIGKIRYLSDDELRSATLYVLLNCVEVEPFVEKYMSLSRQPQMAEFPKWFKKHVADPVNNVCDKYLIQLSKGPFKRVTTYSGYIVNGYRFHTRIHARDMSTVNSGVCVKGTCYNVDESDYYGLLEDVLQLEYGGFPSKKIFLFSCTWFDPSNRGTTTHPKYKIVEINHKRKYNSYEPFILAAQAHQVTYLSYPSLQRDKADWWVAIKIRARNSVSIMEIDPDTSFQEEAVNDRVDIDADEFEITLGDHMARGRGDYSQRLSSGRGSGSGGRGSVGGTGTVGSGHAKTKKQRVVGLGSAASSFCIAPSGPSGESSGQSTRQVTEEIQQLKENLNIKDEEIRRLKEEQESMKEQFNEKLAEVFRRLDGTNEC